MSPEVAAAILLIAVPIAFNVAFFELGRAFDYPNILRKEPAEILRRFAAGGSGLVLRWQALLVSALEFVGPNEKDGWPLAGKIVPVAYIGWSLWLVTLGVFLLL